MNKIVLWVLILVTIIICGPIVTIWCLNTLFPALAIPLNFDTWLATFLIGGLLSPLKVTKK
jgi:hypothetical protein